MLSSDRLKQVVLLLLIAGAIILVATQLYPFLPGLLGAMTLYILLRQWFFKLTMVHHWRPWLAAVLFILGAIVVFVLPFLLSAVLLAPKIEGLMSQAGQVTDVISTITGKLHHTAPQLFPKEAEIGSLLQRLSAEIPSLLGSTLQIFTNLLLCFFLLYFMLLSGRKMERSLLRFISLKAENVENLWDSTRMMVVSNAIGIPVLALVQAIAATIGYLIFGVSSPILWGFLTGIFSMIPVVGAAVVFVPLVVFLYLTGYDGSAIGLLLYAVLVVSNVDNVMRFTLLKRLGDVHPVITVLGVLIGIPLFGFMGLIFGPLLLSYMLLLIRIYRVEFPVENET
ncbi:MAG: AI-2E family transporter [Bacteroidetes bacterium]|nr:AI-2E family transporter [Bacteroidota bacterium]